MYLLQPEDWNDEEDGEWTAPTIPNPEYKGPWTPKVREDYFSSMNTFQIAVLTVFCSSYLSEN